MYYVRDMFGLIQQKVADNLEDAIKDMEKISYMEHLALRLYDDNGKTLQHVVTAKKPQYLNKKIK